MNTTRETYELLFDDMGKANAFCSSRARFGEFWVAELDMNLVNRDFGIWIARRI